MVKKSGRKSGYPIEDIILHRWSPRAMSGEALEKKELMTLFEAARWAPSSGNEQPWRFVYATKGTKYWDEFFGILNKGNQEWCKNSAVLVITLSKTKWEEDNTPNDTHSFDTGAAWENLALQGSSMDLVIHGMEGFDHEKAGQFLKIDDSYKIEMMIAIGKPGKIEVLSPKNQAREKAKDRRHLNEIVFEGRLPIS